MVTEKINRYPIKFKRINTEGDVYHIYDQKKGIKRLMYKKSNKY